MDIELYKGQEWLNELEWARKNWLFHMINERVICFYKNHDEDTEKTNGFSFVIIQDPDTGSREPLFWGTAFFDGIRHLHMGDEEHEDNGYINYPVMENLIASLQFLKELEKKFCRDYFE